MTASTRTDATPSSRQDASSSARAHAQSENRVSYASSVELYRLHHLQWQLPHADNSTLGEHKQARRNPLHQCDELGIRRLPQSGPVLLCAGALGETDRRVHHEGVDRPGGKASELARNPRRCLNFFVALVDRRVVVLIRCRVGGDLVEGGIEVLDGLGRSS